MSRRRRSSPAPISPSVVDIGRPIDWADQLLTGLMVSLLALALLRCIVPVTSNLYWEDDPRADLAAAATSEPDEPLPETPPPQFMGLAGASILDALSLAVAGAALIAHVCAGGALRWGSIVAGAVGICFCVYHAGDQVEDAYICGAWAGGIALAVAALHLASREGQRRWIFAGLIALAAPLAVDAVSFVLVEHGETVKFFQENEEAWLAARGWERNSPEHLMHLRRMSFNEPTGAFAFSNILGSVAAAIAVLAATLAIGLWRQRIHAYRWILPAAFALIAAIVVALTHSKGAPVAGAMAGAMVILSWRWRGHRQLPRILSACAVLAVAVALGLVIVRGMIGPPPDEHGERSILFRWHYWQAAARIAADSPGNALLGVGPAGFADDYNWAKNPLNPEEVRSAHSVFIDLIVNLGIGGAVLAGLLIAWIISAARAAAVALASSQEPPAIVSAPATEEAKPQGAFVVDGRDLAWVVVLLTVLFGCELMIRGASYATPERFLIWSVGMMGAFFAMAVFVSPRWLPAGFDRLALFAAAAVLLIHAQVEMTFFQPSSAPLAWLVLGAAAARGAPVARAQAAPASAATPGLRLAPGALLVIAAIAYAVALTAPIVRQQQSLHEGTLALRAGGQQGYLKALESLANAMHFPPNPKAYEWHARLSMEIAHGIKKSLKDVPVEHVRPATRREIEDYARSALKTLARARAQGLDTISIHRLQAQMLTAVASILPDADYLEQSLAAWRELVIRRPHAWQDRLALADLLWRLGRHDDARAAYAKAIELSDQMYLEPTRMMAPIERRRVMERLADERR